jgi:putative sigma-54 modulation protein
MKVTIRKSNLQWSAALAQYAQRRIENGLHRIGGYVRTACVRLADINGPRGGNDKHCRVTVRLATGDEVVVNALDSCPYRAVDGAVNRLKRTVKKTLHRRRSSGKRRHR